MLLLDVDMPDSEMLEFLPVCRRRAPRLRVLLFTSHPGDARAVDAVRAGAAGFVGKDRPVEELVHAVRTVGYGGTHCSDVPAAVRRNDVPSGSRPHERLSARERQIFARLVRGASPGDIASELDLGSSTVATYLRRIREKSGVESTFELVQYAFRTKLVA